MVRCMVLGALPRPPLSPASCGTEPGLREQLARCWAKEAAGQLGSLESGRHPVTPPRFAAAVESLSAHTPGARQKPPQHRLRPLLGAAAASLTCPPLTAPWDKEVYRWPGEATASAPVGGAPRACPRGPLAQGLSAGGAEGRTTGSWSLHRTRLRPWADLHFALQGPQVWWGSEPRRRPPAPPLDSVLALQSSRRAL